MASRVDADATIHSIVPLLVGMAVAHLLCAADQRPGPFFAGRCAQ